MIVVVNKYLVPKGYAGITVFPFILLRYKSLEHNSVFMNHEKIHIRQQIEMLFVFFYLWYVIEFFIRWILLFDAKKAYRAISLEKEAYTFENEFDYLNNKKIFSFIKFL